MSTKYDRVDVPENVYLHSDNETNEDFGTGVYPISVISRKSNHKKNDTVKLACLRMKRSSRFLLLVGVCIFLVVLLIIVIVSAKNKEYKEKDTEIHETIAAEVKTKGLLFEPSVEGSHLIKYNIRDMKTFHEYLQHLDFYMYDYSAVHQQVPQYVDCYNESAPEGKACRLTAYHFGKHCSHHNSYGYSQGRPCVLLMLKLDNDTVIEPFTSQDTEIQSKLKDRWEENHVGVTCDGETDYDREHIGNDDFWYEDGVKESLISYHPPNGFPVWFYPQKNRFYRVPAVMVHFNTIHTHHLVTIKCTAWAKSFYNGKPQDSKIYSVRFQIYME